MVALHTSYQLCDPLLHCEIGIGNNLLELLKDIINEHLEIYAPGEESIRLAVPALKQIIANTAKQRDAWDESDEGDTWKTLKLAVATHQKRQQSIVDFIEDNELIVDSIEDKGEATYTSNMIKLTPPSELSRCHGQQAQEGTSYVD